MSTIEIQVSASLDDARRGIFTNDWSLTATNLVGCYSSASYQWGAAMRFLNAQIPKGATITAAYIKLCSPGDRAVNTVNTRLRAQAHDSPPTFSTAAEFDARAWTTAKANWDAIAAWVTNNWYQSPDIKACIQEVIDRAGWASGNAIAVLWDDFEDRSSHVTACYRYGYSYDGSTTLCPILHIEFTPPHPILESRYTSQSQEINSAYVIGRDDNGINAYGSSTDSAELALVGERLDFALELEIPTAAMAADVAAAILAKHRLNKASGFLLIPPNCGVELWDVIAVTDTPANQAAAKYRVTAIHFEYHPKQAKYEHKLIIGAP